MPEKTESTAASMKIVNDYVNQLMKDDQAVLAVGVALFIVLLTIIWLLLGRKRKGGSLLLMGLSDSGKTALFTRLTHETVKQTVTSMKCNKGMYVGKLPSGKKAQITVADVPGYEKLRFKFFDELKADCGAIVFLVDSATFQKQIKDVAEFLYQVLTDSTIEARRPPLLIACHKQDLPLVKSADAVEALLEREFNLLRRTQTATLGSSEETGKFIGRRDKDFEFCDLALEVDFCESGLAIQGGKDSISDITHWIGQKLG